MSQPDTVEDRVLEFTAQQWGVQRQKLSTNTRLAQDLGMDGDDAVEFFEEFGKKFKVNLDDLHVRWGQHFGPEGGPSFGVFVVIVLCVTAGFLLRDFIGILPAWVWGFALIVIAFMLYRHWFGVKTMVPITVSDLIDSVRLGRWSKPYSADK